MIKATIKAAIATALMLILLSFISRVYSKAETNFAMILADINPTLSIIRTGILTIAYICILTAILTPYFRILWNYIFRITESERGKRCGEEKTSYQKIHEKR